MVSLTSFAQNQSPSTGLFSSVQRQAASTGALRDGAAEDLKALTQVADTLNRLTDPKARLATAQATLQRDLDRAEAELEALNYLRVISPERAAKAAEAILARIDGAVAAYASEARALSRSGGDASSGSSPEATADALKAAAQKAAQAPAEIPNVPEIPELPDQAAVTEEVKENVQSQLLRGEARQGEALKALRDQGAEVARRHAETRGQQEFLDQIRGFVDRVEAIAEGGDDDGGEDGESAARIRSNLQKAAGALTSVAVPVRLPLPELGIRV